MPMSDASTAPLGIVTCPRLVEHRPADGSPHVERPERYAVMLEAEASVEHLAMQPPAEPADDKTLLRVHGRSHLDQIAALSKMGGWYDADTYVGVGSDELARSAVACGMTAADAVLSKRCRRAMSLVRPPGHHAEPDKAMGFCLYSTAAIVVRHLQHVHSVQRVAVVDFDVHHGNGTQAAFWRDPDVLSVSVHEDPATLWPGTGTAAETGGGAGEATTVNVPLPAGSTGDVMLAALRDVVLPRLREHRPEIIVACCGFDAHAADPLANLQVDTDTFGVVGQLLVDAADELCDGRLVGTVEGGYDLAALRDSLRSFLGAWT